MTQKIFALGIAISIPFFTFAQVLGTTPVRTIKTSKAEVVSLAMAPKGDRILAGLNKGAELYDIEKGSKVNAFPFNEDGAAAVYHAGFNENGEYVILIGHSGKRQIWDVKSGKQEKVLSEHRWIPDSRAVKAMGLDMKNSAFDRFYQQSEVQLNGNTIRSVKDGAIEVVDPDGKVLQKLEFPENKDQHHRAPLLVHDGHLITGTDDGRILFFEIL